MNRLTSSLLFLLLIAAPARAAITGTVVDENGKPIAGATIRVFPTETTREARKRMLSGKPEREPLSVTTSKEDGTFSADTKGAAAVDMVVEAGARRRVAALADNLDLGPVLLREPSPRTIKVTAAGKPLANALVVFTPNTFTRTDAAGNFTANEPGGAVTVIHPDYAIEQIPIGNINEVKLSKGTVLRGRVLGTDGKPAAKATVTINNYVVAETADDGTFTIQHAPSSWQAVFAFAGTDVGFAPRGSGGAVEIRLRRGAIVNGTVRDTVTGDPVPGAMLVLYPNGFRTEGLSVASDAKGRFAFDPAPPGSYSLGGQHWGYSVDGGAFTLSESLTRSVAARPHARVYGRVIDEARKPVAGALVSAAGQPNSTNRTITDAAGNFLLRLPAEQRLLRAVAMKRGFAAGMSQRWTLKPGEVVKDAVITLPQGFPLQVRVLDRAHKPVAGVRVGLGMRDEQWAVPAACEDPARDACSLTDAAGTVTWRAVEGDYHLSARGELAKIVPVNREVTLNARSSPFTLDVEAGALLAGKVVYADGTPVANAEVEIEGGNIRRSEMADGAGMFTIDSLPPSRVVLTAHTPDRRLASAAVEVTAPAPNVTISMPRGGRIEGRVTERGTGRPITDFTVQPARRGVGFGPMVAQPVHSDEGTFVLDNVAPGNATINVGAAGYVTAARGGIVVEEGATVSNVEVQLERGARVTGRVTAGGKPLAGVAVMISPGPGNLGGGPAANRAVTDGDGEYALDGVSAGERSVDFRKTGYVTRKKTVEIEAAKDLRLDMELDHGRELRGRVVDAGGTGVAGVNVGAQPAGFGPDDARAVSESDGSFTIEGLSESRYNITARKSGYVTATERDVEVPASAPLTLTLKSGATVTGRVTGLPENELAGVMVNAFSQMGPGNAGTSAQTDAAGNFTLRGVPDGQVSVSASTRGGERRAQPKTITVTNGGAPPVEIDFAEGYTMRGRITINGVPLDGGSMSFMPTTPGAGRQFGYGRINNGLYEVSGLGSGEYRVNINGPEVRYEEKLQISGSATRNFEIRGANIRGRVVDAATGAPVPNAGISVRGKSPASGRGTQTDSDGRFLVAALSDDSYTLNVTAPPYAPATRDLVVAGGSAPEVEVRLEGGTPVVVRIVDAATGRILSYANASVADAKGFITGNMQRGEEGLKFYLHPGQYTLNVFAPGYVPQQKVPLSVPSSDMRVAMQRGGNVLFRTTEARRVRLMAPGAARPAYSGTAAPNAPSGAQNLAPGGYVAEVLGKGDVVEKSIPVTVIAGETVTVMLD